MQTTTTMCYCNLIHVHYMQFHKKMTVGERITFFLISCDQTNMLACFDYICSGCNHLTHTPTAYNNNIIMVTHFKGKGEQDGIKRVN